MLNTGADAVRDIAGNVADQPGQRAVRRRRAVAGHRTSSSAAPSFVTNPTATQGTRENPYPTIGAAMTAAAAGDVVAVLPGVYTEQVTLKQFVRLLSAAPSSTDSTVFTTSTGDALSTIIRAPFVAAAPAGTYITVIGDRLESFAGLSDRDRRLHDRQPAGRRPGDRLDQPERGRRRRSRIPTS